MYAIGIDVGTTNCKVCLYRVPEISLMNKYSFPTPKNSSEHGSDFDINALWHGIINGLSLAVQAVSDPEQIVSISVASVGEAGVLLDDEDQIIGPVMTWYDTRTQPQLERVVARLGEERLYEITGIPAHSNYSLNKILWLMEHAPQRKAARWLCLAEYIAYRLSGVKRAEYSLASRTLAFDIHAGAWSQEICRAMALPEGIFSPLVRAGEPIGGLLPVNRQLTGISGGAQIAIAGHDHMCGSVAVGITDEDQILNSTGTTEGLLVICKQAAVTPEYYRSRLSNGCHVLRGAYTLYASLPSAGYAIEWFRHLFDVSADDFVAMTDRLMASAAASQPDNSFLIPHLRGSGPPKRCIFSKGLLYGIGEKTAPEELLRALFQGLCFELRMLMETYEALAGRHWGSVMVIGAACQNPYWLQLKANILNREIVSCRIPEAVSRGAAMIGARGAGYEPVESSLAENAVVRYLPDAAAAARFKDIYTQIYQPLHASKIHIESKINRIKS
ncbi:FGGY-family carbohydrate kinase [Gibbsiella dentisursi]